MPSLSLSLFSFWSHCSHTLLHSDLSSLDYCVWGWMKELVYSVKVVTRDALLDRILDAADRIRNSQRKLQRATRAVHNRAANCIVAGGRIFENRL